MKSPTTRLPSLRLIGDGDEAPSALRSFDLDRDVTILGRDSGCDLMIGAPAVSRRHAHIVRRPDGYYLGNLSLSAGTRLNGVPLDAPARLRDGDRIAIGTCVFAFEAPPPEDETDPDSTILGVRDVSGTAERERIGDRPEEKLRALLEIGRALAADLDLRAVLGRTLDALFRIFPQAERGFVVLKGEGDDGPANRAVKLRDGVAGPVVVSRTVFDHVVRHGQAVLIVDVIADDRFVASRSIDEAQLRTLMAAPLKDHLRRTIGLLQLDTRDRRVPFTSGDLDVLAAVAGQLSAALENARLLDAAARERRRLSLLAEAGAVLAATHELPASLGILARLLVPPLGDLCLIDLRDDDGAVRRVAGAHADPALQALLDEELRRYPPDPDSPHPAMRVLRTGVPELANDLPVGYPEGAARDAEHLALARRLGFASYLVVPLWARGRTLGALSLIGAAPGRRYGPDELECAEEIALRIALALDNAALYRVAQDARRQAEAANRAKDLFLAMLSHELRTPLTPILAVASARLGIEADPERRAELEMIRRNVVLESRLIDDLLDLSRIECGQLRLDLEVVDVHRLLGEAAAVCREECAAAGLAVTLDLAARAHHVAGDGARLLQIAWNLIRNAAKFTPPGGALAIRSDDAGPPDSEGGGGRLVIEFADTGRGIEPEWLSRIFAAFERVGEDARPRGGSLGLGLAIGRSLAEAHGGSLTAASAGTGLGSTFRLELPTVPAPPAESSAAAPAPGPPGVRALRILLVEDNRDTRRFLALILSGWGHEVRAAASLAEARVAADAGLDLLVSDIELPDGSGLDLMRELSTRGIPGIAMSGYGTEEDVQLSRDAGFATHLTKPMDAGRLEMAIRLAAG